MRCNAEQCLRAKFGDVSQVTREGGRGRKATILKIRECADKDQEKRRCQCVGVNCQHIDVMKRRWQKAMAMASIEGEGK